MRRGVKISFQKISRLALTTVVLIIVSGTALSTAGPRPMCASPAFYPSSPISLYDQVQTFSRPCAVRLSGKPLTLIVPSEAYIFVGALLGQAYTVVSDSRFDRIVILGYDESANPATVYSGPDLVTPMGGNPVDNALCAQLLRISPANLTDADPKACLPKSIEIQLPFLQKHFPRVPVVPIGIDGLDPEASLDLGNLLAELTKDNPTLFIVVTNLSSTFDIRTCESRDNRFVEKLKNCRFAEIMTELEKGTISLESSGAFIAGITPAILAGADDCKVLRYENTGRITGDHQRVCGYLSAVITGDRQISGPEFEIPAEVGAKLLKHARSTIEISAGKLSTPVPKSEIPENIPIDGIHIDIITDFRASGVGIMRPEAGLYNAIRNAAYASAFNDPRYNPIEKDQTDDFKLRLYLIGNLTRLTAIEDFRPGQKGVWIKQGNVSAKYFPHEIEIAPNNKDIFGKICLKAGLFSDCWKDANTEIRVFDVQVFEEER